jgi:ATP-dependent Zn protease
MALVQFLVARLKEPSTYAGLGALLAAAGVHLHPDVLSAATSAAMALAGLAAVLIPERSSS